MRVIMIFMFAFLVGCSEDNKVEQKKGNEQIKFSNINVGIVGDKSLPSVPNVNYNSVDLKSLDGNSEEIDALIIMKDSFSEADKDEYVDFYKGATYPIFFLGMEHSRMFAFTKEGISLDDATDDNVAYVQGFINVNKGRHGWKFF